MPRPINAIFLGTALLAASATTALPFEFQPDVNKCVVDVQPQCFDPLLAELSERIASLKDDQFRDNYVAIPTVFLLKANLPGRAEDISKKIEDPNKRAEMLGYIGSAYARAGLIDDAYRILGDTEDPQTRAMLIVTIASFELRDGDVDQTMPSIIDLMDPEFVDSTFAEIAIALIDRGQLNKASRIAEFIFDPRQQAYAFARLSREYAKVGNVPKAISHLNLMRDPSIQVLAWGDVGFTLHDRGYETEAKHLYDEAVALATGRDPDDSGKDAQLESIAHHLIKSSHADDALPIIELVQNPEVRAYLFQRIGSHYAEKGEIVEALKYFEIAVPTAISGDDKYRKYATLSQIAISLAKIGQVSRALSVASSIQEANIEGSALKSIGDKLLEQGDIARADEIFTSIDHPDLRAVALIGFSKFLDSEGVGQKANAILTNLEATLAAAPVEASDFQDGIYLRGSSFSILSGAFVDRGDLSSGLRVALTIEETDQQLWTLIPIFGAAVEAGDDVLAGKLSETLFAELQAHPKPGNVLSVLSYIATLPANLQNIESHKKYASLLDDSRSRSLLFSGIFENLTMTENLALAYQVLELIPENSFRDAALIELLKRRIERITTLINSRDHR